MSSDERFRMGFFGGALALLNAILHLWAVILRMLSSVAFYICVQPIKASRNSYVEEEKRKEDAWFSDRKFRRKFIARDKSGNLRIIPRIEENRENVLSSLANPFSLENIRSTISKRSYGIQILNQCNCIERNDKWAGKIILLQNPFFPYYHYPFLIFPLILCVQCAHSFNLPVSIKFFFSSSSNFF